MHTLLDFLLDIGLIILACIPAFAVSAIVLWKLRSRGIWTVVLGPVVGGVLSNLVLIAFPGVFRYHYAGVGMSPVETGIMSGCIVPAGFMALYHLTEAKKKQAASLSHKEDVAES